MREKWRTAVAVTIVPLAVLMTVALGAAADRWGLSAFALLVILIIGAVITCEVVFVSRWLKRSFPRRPL